MQPVRKFKNYIRNKTWVFLKAKWKLRSGLQTVVENDSDWFVFNEIFTNKEYEPALQLLQNKSISNPLVLDLGANVGYFSLQVADLLLEQGIKDFEVIAVEGSPSNYEKLSERLRQPQLEKKVKAYLGLAGSRTGAKDILHSTEHYGHSAGSAAQGSNAVSVNYIDVEKLIGDANRRIQLLKCDIEGSEELFLKEYKTLLSRVDIAVFEFHADDCDVPHCRSMLQEAGLISKGIFKEDKNFKTTTELFSRS